jgi:CubicO group peptidase (beta-lactamase class C family)
MLERYTRDDRMPGVMVALQRRGKLAYLGKAGSAVIATRTPIQEDHLFRIYSMTKPLISIAMMMLYEDGALSLNDPLADYIPAFAHTKVFDGMGNLGMRLVAQRQPITLHHLLTHTSGLSYGWYFDTPVEDLYRAAVPEMFKRDEPLEKTVNLLAELPLVFQPGTQWRYSYATDVLAHVVQVASGMALEDFMRARIFEPLRMIDTSFSVPAEKIGRLAELYRSDGLYDPIAVPPSESFLIGDVTTPTRCPSGGAGLLSTLADYLNFANFLLNRGVFDGNRLMSRKTLDWMASNHIPQSQLPLKIGDGALDFGFGLGFRVAIDLGQARTVTSVGEFGWAGAANTYFWVDPAEEYIGVMMTQYLPLLPSPVQERVRILAYQAIVD